MKKSLIYLGVSVFVFIFGQIYEYFSHGVYSSYMMYAVQYTKVYWRYMERAELLK